MRRHVVAFPVGPLGAAQTLTWLSPQLKAAPLTVSVVDSIVEGVGLKNKLIE